MLVSKQFQIKLIDRASAPVSIPSPMTSEQAFEYLSQFFSTIEWVELVSE